MQGKDGGIPSKATATKIKRSEQCGIMWYALHVYSLALSYHHITVLL